MRHLTWPLQAVPSCSLSPLQAVPSTPYMSVHDARHPREVSTGVTPSLQARSLRPRELNLGGLRTIQKGSKHLKRAMGSERGGGTRKRRETQGTFGGQPGTGSWASWAPGRVPERPVTGQMNNSVGAGQSGDLCGASGQLPCRGLGLQVWGPGDTGHQGRWVLRGRCGWEAEAVPEPTGLGPCTRPHGSCPCRLGGEGSGQSTTQP